MQQNIHLDGSLKTAGNQRGNNKPRRQTKKERRQYWRRRFTELSIQDQLNNKIV